MDLPGFMGITRIYGNYRDLGYPSLGPDSGQNLDFIPVYDTRYDTTAPIISRSGPTAVRTDDVAKSGQNSGPRVKTGPYRRNGRKSVYESATNAKSGVFNDKVQQAVPQAEKWIFRV